MALTFVSVYIENGEGKNTISLYLKIKVLTMKTPLTLVKSLLAVAGVAALSAVSAAPTIPPSALVISLVAIRLEMPM